MATATYNWPDTSTKIGIVSFNSVAVFYDRQVQADDFAPTAQRFAPATVRGFREVDLASLAIPTTATVNSATLTRDIAAADADYEVCGADPISTSIAGTTAQQHYTAIGSGVDYQNTPSSETSGQVVTVLNAAGLADLQARITAGAATFMLGLRLVDEATDSNCFEDGYAATQSFVIDYTEGASSDIATINGVARASISAVNGLAIADVASVNGLE